MAKRLVSGWSLIGALITVIVLLLVYSVMLRLIFPVPTSPIAEPTPIMLVINAATSTSVIPVKTNPGSFPTATIDPKKFGGIAHGQYVQISGTGGDGLRIRSGAGTDKPPLFLGWEAEVFQVLDGPREANALVWWFLVSPSDENRKGWAASSYLTIVSPNP